MNGEERTVSLPWSVYVTEAMRFCNPATETDIRVAALGLVSEVGELAGLAQKQLEGKSVCAEQYALEIGDALWRVAHLDHAAGIGLYNAGWEANALPSTGDDVIGAITNLAKMFRADDLLSGSRQMLCNALQRIRYRLLYVGWSIGYTMTDLCEMNLAKLRRRHGSSWLPHDEQNREQG